MACSPAISTSRVTNIPYSVVQDKSSDISKDLEAGFGPEGLGIIAISGVPLYSEMRQKLLLLAERLAALPESVKKGLEDPSSRYSFGWSHGKEFLESGRPDILKGSFYANPIVDNPTSKEELMQRYPSCCLPNVWPTNDLPELEQAFKDLGQLIIKVGYLLAYHCDKYVMCKSGDTKIKSLEETISKSRCPKGRLLHYFAPSISDESQTSESISSWCGWHTDHGSLTGLTCAMYIKDGVEVPCPDTDAGLYIKTNNGKIVKAFFKEDEIAYQMGEITEFLTKGLLHATPHCVRTPTSANGYGITRNTFAVFMQPNWDFYFRIGDTNDAKDGDTGKYIHYGDFSEQTLTKYYK